MAELESQPLSDEERAELEELRAEKARREAREEARREREELAALRAERAKAEEVADVTTQHVVEDLVDINFGPDEPAPRLVFDEIGAQSAATVEALKLLHDAGLLDEDEVLKQFIRVKFKLPRPDPKADPEPAPPAQPDPQAPPAPDDAPPDTPQEGQ